MLTNKNRAALAISTLWTALCLVVFTGCQPSGPKSLLLGDKYVRQGEYQKALKYLARAAVLMPERPEVWNFQGLAYHWLQQPSRAAEAYGRALRINKNFAPAHYNLGVLLLEQDRVPEAVAELTAYTSLQPNDDAGWARLGAALVRARKPDEADRALAQALKLNPKNADAYNSSGMVHTLRKRPREAVQAFNTALNYRPGFGAALLNQAIVSQQYFGNNQIALERYHAFLKTKPNPKAAAAVQLAIRDIERANQPAPPPPIALPDLTTNTGIAALLRSNLLAQAERTRQEAAAQKAAPPPSAPAVVSNTIKSNLLVATSNAPVRVAAAPPTNPPVMVAAAPKTNAPPPEPETVEAAPPVEVVDLDKEDAALVLPEVKDTPAFPSTNQQLALNNSAPSEQPPLIAPRKRDDEEKRGILERLKQAPSRWFEHDEPRPVPIPPQRTASAETTGAAPRLAPAVRPLPIARYDYRKNLNISRGNRAQAEKLFTQAATAHRQRRLPEAIGLYRQALALDPSYFEAAYNLGLAAYQSNDLPLALSANEQAVAIKPSSVDARYNFALTLRASRYFIDAANELRELLSVAPNDSRAHLALANLYLQNLDEQALARTHYQRFLELAPNHPDADSVRQLLIMRR